MNTEPSLRKLFAVAFLALSAQGCQRESAAPHSGGAFAASEPLAAATATVESTIGEPRSVAFAKPASAPSAAEPAANQADPPREAAAEEAEQPIRDITFDTIKFEMTKGDPFDRKMLTPAIERLAGKRIRVRGYIFPTSQQTINQFVLVRDNMECCFGPGAALFDCIVVEMQPGKTAEYTTRPVAVEGTFSLREYKGLDDKHLAIYHLLGETVQ